MLDSKDISFDVEEFMSIVKSGNYRSCDAGEVIFTMGSTGREMYILIEGEVELAFTGGKQKKQLHKGAFFGELAFVMGEHQRTATARATKKTQLAVLDENAVTHLRQNNPDLLFSLLRRTCIYLFRSEQSLINDLKEKNSQLQKTLDFLRVTKEELGYQEVLAQTDQLTGLYNRRCFDSQLENFISRSQHIGQNLGLLMLDLDGFKLINDTHGHQYGDEILFQVADVLKSSCRTTDLPCRLGGDEFVLLMPNFDSSAGYRLGEGIRRRVFDLPPIAQESDLKVTVSIGGTVYRAGEGSESFMERADKNLYRAKDMGRNTVVWEDSPEQ